MNTNLQAVTDVHLGSAGIQGDIIAGGSFQAVKIFSIIAVFILVIAWLNFVNLSTARSAETTKSVGIRKVMGAFQKQLIMQFMVESLLINLIAALISILVALGLLAILNDIMGSSLTFTVFKYPEFWFGYSALVLLGSIVSGFYPSFVLSSFKSVNIQRITSKNSRMNFSLRKGLMVFQFFISAILIAGTLLVYKQITIMKNQDLGFDMEQILIVPGPSIISDFNMLKPSIETFKNESLGHSSVLAAASSGTIPGKGHISLTGTRKLGDPIEVNQPSGITYIDSDFFETYKLEFISGRPFDLQSSMERVGVIINGTRPARRRSPRRHRACPKTQPPAPPAARHLRPRRGRPPRHRPRPRPWPGPLAQARPHRQALARTR
jgi:putative ABC transport system permease protein